MESQSTHHLVLSSAAPTALVTRDFALVLAIQASFGLSCSLVLLLPTFLAVRHGAHPDTIGWANATPNLAAVASVPVAGWLIDRVGRRPLMLVGGLLGAVGSLGFLAGWWCSPPASRDRAGSNRSGWCSDWRTACSIRPSRPWPWATFRAPSAGQPCLSAPARVTPVLA